MIRGVIFDCFGVLVHGSLDHLRALAPPERLSELNDLSRQSDYGFLSQAEYKEGVGSIIGRSPEEIGSIMRAQFVPNKQLIALARSLRPDYKVALLSNVGRGLIDTIFTPQELNELFDTIVLSSEVGMVKPHAGIYELTAIKLGLTPEECIMIDDLPVNVEGAELVGMKGLVCNNIAQCEADLARILRENNA